MEGVQDVWLSLAGGMAVVVDPGSPSYSTLLNLLTGQVAAIALV